MKRFGFALGLALIVAVLMMPGNMRLLIDISGEDFAQMVGVGTLLFIVVFFVAVSRGGDDGRRD